MQDEPQCSKLCDPAHVGSGLLRRLGICLVRWEVGGGGEWGEHRGQPENLSLGLKAARFGSDLNGGRDVRPSGLIASLIGGGVWKPDSS